MDLCFKVSDCPFVAQNKNELRNVVDTDSDAAYFELFIMYVLGDYW